MPKAQKVVDLKNICIRKKLDEVSISKTLINKVQRPNSGAKENSASVAAGYQTGIENSLMFGYGHQQHKVKSSNVMLAPITAQYMSNNNVFNLATKRR